jgi:hypothetical protein
MPTKYLITCTEITGAAQNAMLLYRQQNAKRFGGLGFNNSNLVFNTGIAMGLVPLAMT